MVLSAVLVPSVLALLVSTTFYLTIGKFIRTSHDLSEADAIVSGSYHTMKLLVDMETGQRGFLVSGKQEFLQPYDSAKEAIGGSFSNLTSLLATDETLRAHLDDARHLTEQWQTNAAAEIARKIQKGDYISIFNAGTGKSLMDRIRSQFDFIIDAEQRQRTAKLAVAATSSVQLLWVTLAVALVAGGLSGGWSGMRIVTLYKDYLYQLELLDLAHDAIIVRDPQSRIKYWNSGATRTYGWDRNEAADKVTHQLLQTVFPVSRDATDWSLKNEGKWEGELVHRSKTGTILTVQSRQVLAQSSRGRPRAILEINRDITAFKKYQTELVSAKTEAEKANAAKTSFLADVSHELRTPLNAIVQNTELGSGDDDLRRVKGRLTIIAHEATSLRRLIDDLLASSKLESGRSEVIVKRFLLADFLKRLERLEPGAYGHRDSYSVTNRAAAGLELNTDQEKLFHCLSNLVTNAFKFVKNGNIILDVNVSADQKLLMFAVSDDGPGIPGEERSKIFTAFWQGTSAVGEHGIGLGLSLSKRYSELLGGTIAYYPIEPSGSRFEVIVPIALERIRDESARRG
jgi:two-component system sensor kinase FixL